MKYFLLIFLISSSFLLAQNGSVKTYFPDHKVKSELFYVNDILDGPAVWYHPNGKVMIEKTYSKGILEGWVREYFDNGQLKNEFNVKNGIKDGDEKKYFQNGNLNEILSYTNGKLLKKQTFDSSNEPEKKEEIAITNQPKLGSLQKDKSTISNTTHEFPKEIPNAKFEVADVITQPEIVGSIFSIQDNIIYPQDAIKFGLEGTVSIKATIDEKGNAVKADVIKGIGLGCDEAAIKAVKQNKYLPGTKNGNPIESILLIDVPFKLPIKKQEIAKEEPKTVEASKQQRKYEENLSVMCEADRCPRPEDDIATIYSLFQIPNVAKALKLRGMILIEGIVSKDGKFSQTKIIEGVGYGCDQLVETALQKSKFTPGVKKGEPVETKALINFPFSYDR